MSTEITHDRTNRGFAKTEFYDTYNSKIRLQESSSVAPRIWIFCDNPSFGEVVPAPHLNVEQAKIVIDTLTEWINKIEKLYSEEEC